MELIDKNKVLDKIQEMVRDISKKDAHDELASVYGGQQYVLMKIFDFIDNLETTRDPYSEMIQYDSIEVGIKAHAETYSFNIESILFNQLTKEQQSLWRKEIEQAVISGGEVGVELAKDMRYSDNIKIKLWHDENDVPKYNLNGITDFIISSAYGHIEGEAHAYTPEQWSAHLGFNANREFRWAYERDLIDFN